MLVCRVFVQLSDQTKNWIGYSFIEGDSSALTRRKSGVDFSELLTSFNNIFQTFMDIVQFLFQSNEISFSLVINLDRYKTCLVFEFLNFTDHHYFLYLHQTTVTTTGLHFEKKNT